jgi:spore coat polysaccharide biosynthesis predicted glycosyltransferase SpsG
MILFYISVGKNIGIGHLKRCGYLAQKLKQLNFDLKFIIINDKYSIDYLKKNQFKYKIVKNIEFDIINNNTIINDYRVILLDMLNINGVITRALKEKNTKIKIIALDYFDMEDSNVDTIINLINHNPNFTKPIHKKVKYLEGVKYGIIRNEFIPFTNKAKKKSNIFKILITFGGSDPQNYTLRILPNLVPLLEMYLFNVEIIVGPNYIYTEILNKYINILSLDCIKIIFSPNNIPEIMHDSDVVISGSGTTAIELATLGIPSILLPQNINELHFAEIFKNAGFSIIGCDLDEIFFNKIFQYITDIYHGKISTENINKIGKKMCQGNGTELICNEIIELYGN